ncbi:MAG: phosphopantetheine-binding protein [Flaviflexus sp.]|nr:phosphopantetheine-binding protein [Flaviflexus sp.]
MERLEQVRSLLATIAPEIEEAEIVPEARIDDDLRLDQVSRFALGVGLERETKKTVPDRDICEAATLGDLMALFQADTD